MKRRPAALGLAVWLCVAAGAVGLDTVRTEKRAFTGKVTAMTAQEVTLDPQVGDKQVIPVNEIVGILFDGEPPQLNLVRNALASGRFEDAQTILSKIDAEKIERPEVRQDVQFLRALCAARLASRGVGTILEAGGLMAAFVQQCPGNYHWFEANELVGDLLVATRRYSDAAQYYAAMGKAPWPDYRMRADVAIGHAFLADGKPADARAAFDRVLAQPASDKAADIQRAFAQLGLAECLTAQGKASEAVDRVQQVILKANPEDIALNARAYNTLGNVLRKTDKPQDALLAYLHVDLLYFASAEDHAEALANLAELWNQVHQPERAVQAQQILKERYKNSRWASR